MLAKFFNDEKLTFATNSANLPTSWLQTRRDLFGSFLSIFHLKFRMQFHLFFIYIIPFILFNFILKTGM
ncbi:PIN family toxin-antitoxin system [Fusobacterium animalis]|uniref:PIN family toxin-antitoxin system n=1 Tax=Fusobacterium animalis TaxID=76859 RepID=A0A2G9FHV0_9FUSO|nr:PIN family toxin-antitoxin system [Fusobacterium animalis]